MKLQTSPKANTQIIQLIDLKDGDWLAKLRVAGKIVAQTLNILENLVKERSPLSLLEMSQLAEDFILQNSALPTFKGYKGFPEAVCISVNKELVHGIPKADVYLKEGDVVSFDLGATFEGAIADAAITCVYGEADPQHLKLIQATQECLQKSIDAVKVGKRLGVIGQAIYTHARNQGLSVVEDYGGHGIGDKPHMHPFVANKARPNEGIRMATGLTIAIEPMLLLRGPVKLNVLEDGWTVMGNGISAHQEHSIYLHPDGAEVLTQL